MQRAMYTADMAFFARVADPLVGGTYMTLMNISYLGGKIFKTMAMWLVDVLTWKSCGYSELTNSTILLTDNKCISEVDIAECKESGGECQIDIDGYYVEVGLNVVFGIFWFQWARKIICRLQKLPVSDWHVLSNRLKADDTELEPLKVKVDV